MSRTTRIILLSVFALSLALGAVWTITRPPTPVVASKPAIGLSNQSETWNLGVTVEGAPAYADILDRLVGESAAFRSNRGVNEMSFIFPASSVTRLVQTASVNLVSRSGSYPGTADLSLEAGHHLAEEFPGPGRRAGKLRQGGQRDEQRPPADQGVRRQ